MQLFDNCENLFRQDVTIKNGASASEIFLTEGRALVGIIMPAVWTAANLGFNVGATPATMGTCKDAGGNLEKAVVTQGNPCAWPSADALKFPFLQILSTNTDGTGAAVNQGGDRALTLIFARVFGGA